MWQYNEEQYKTYEEAEQSALEDGIDPDFLCDEIWELSKDEIFQLENNEMGERYG